jgi:hypothetical protein
MVKVTSEKESTRRWVEGSILAFLRGRKNLNWVIGIIRNGGINRKELGDLFSTFRKDYCEKTRFQELEKKCRQSGLL